MGSNCCSKKNQCCPQQQQQCCEKKGPRTDVCAQNVHIWHMMRPQQQMQQAFGMGCGGFQAGGGFEQPQMGGCGMGPPLPLTDFNNGVGFNNNAGSSGFAISPPSFQPQYQPESQFNFQQYQPQPQPQFQNSSSFFQPPPSFQPQPQFQNSSSFFHPPPPQPQPLPSFQPQPQPMPYLPAPAANCSSGQCQPAPPVQTVQRIVTMRREQVPIQRQVRTMQPVTRNIRVKVPVQRAVHGTRQVEQQVTVPKQKVEYYTKMVPVKASRVITVPTIEKRYAQVPTVNYVTDYVDQEKQVTEMQERVNTVTDYVTREVPVVTNCIRTRYETVQTVPGNSFNNNANSQGFNGSSGFMPVNYSNNNNNHFNTSFNERAGGSGLLLSSGQYDQSSTSGSFISNDKKNINTIESNIVRPNENIDRFPLTRSC